MKRLNQILIIVFLTLGFISCNKDDDGNNEEIIKQEAISAKWTVSGTSDYESFEFNKSGNYIVVKNLTTKSTNNQIVLFGTYEIINNTIVLSDFGTIKVSNIGEDAISFTITLNSNPKGELSIQATKQDIISNSTKTKLLCRTWEVVTLGGIDIGYVVVLFSDAGTYFLETSDWNGYGTWTWCDTEESKIAFTLDDVLDCSGIDIIKDIELTADSFTGIDTENNGVPLEMILQPVSSTKSAHLTNTNVGQRYLE